MINLLRLHITWHNVKTNKKLHTDKVCSRRDKTGYDDSHLYFLWSRSDSTSDVSRHQQEHKDGLEKLKAASCWFLSD